jgi:transposase
MNEPTMQTLLLYLPSYSPHLNLIERLWRFVRQECLSVRPSPYSISCPQHCFLLKGYSEPHRT